MTSTNTCDAPGWVPGAPLKREQPGHIVEETPHACHDYSRPSTVTSHPSSNSGTSTLPGWVPGAPLKREQPGGSSEALAHARSNQLQAPVATSSLSLDACTSAASTLSPFYIHPNADSGRAANEQQVVGIVPDSGISSRGSLPENRTNTAIVDCLLVHSRTSSSEQVLFVGNNASAHGNTSIVCSFNPQHRTGWLPGAPLKREQPGPAAELSCSNNHGPPRSTSGTVMTTSHPTRCASPGWLPGAPPKGEQPGDHEHSHAPAHTEQLQHTVVRTFVGQDPVVDDCMSSERTCNHANVHELVTIGVDANSHDHMQAHTERKHVTVQSVNSGSKRHNTRSTPSTAVPGLSRDTRSRSPNCGPRSTTAAHSFSSSSIQAHQPPAALGEDLTAHLATNLEFSSTSPLQEQLSSTKKRAHHSGDNFFISAESHAELPINCDNHHDRRHLQDSPALSSFSTFAQRPAYVCGYTIEQASCTSMQADIPSHADATKRMRADIAALVKHGVALGVTHDTIRTAIAYQHHVESFYAGLQDSEVDCAAPSLSPGPTDNINIPSCGLVCGIEPAHKRNRFSGVDPNGCDGPLVSPAIPTRHC